MLRAGDGHVQRSQGTNLVEHCRFWLVRLCFDLILPNSGEKLRDMLLQHGNFSQVEIELTKISTQTQINDEEGAWENEVSLAQEGWTE